MNMTNPIDHLMWYTAKSLSTILGSMLVGIILLFSGCSPVPITDGFHSELPTAGTRIIVWGNHPAVVETATTWLKKQGLYTFDPASVGRVLKKKDVQWVHTFQDEMAVLQAAEILGAEQVVFTNRLGDRRAPGVSVRGVRVKTNQVMWIGSGRYSDYLKNPENDLLAKLTCQALATAWGYRPAGKKRFVSSLGLCMVERSKQGKN